MAKSLIQMIANNSGFDLPVGEVNGWHGFEIGANGTVAWIKADTEAGQAYACVFSSSTVMANLQGSTYQASSPVPFAPVINVLNRDALYELLTRACVLALTLPKQPLTEFKQAVEAIDIDVTEAVAFLKRRIGQDKYREAQIQYWGGRCALTGVTNLNLLRASHSLAWADCSSAEEQLDIYNGFLFAAHIDAAFDKGLLSFQDDGRILISPSLSDFDRKVLGIHPASRLSRIRGEHAAYLRHHRKKYGYE